MYTYIVRQQTKITSRSTSYIILSRCCNKFVQYKLAGVDINQRNIYTHISVGYCYKKTCLVFYHTMYIYTLNRLYKHNIKYALVNILVHVKYVYTYYADHNNVARELVYVHVGIPVERPKTKYIIY